MKKSDKGYIKPVKKEKVEEVKTPCKKKECFVETYYEGDEEITECKTCGKIIDIK